MVNSEGIPQFRGENTKMDDLKKSFDDPSKMHLLIFLKSGNIYLTTFYGKRWAVMEVIFG